MVFTALPAITNDVSLLAKKTVTLQAEEYLYDSLLRVQGENVDVVIERVKFQGAHATDGGALRIDAPAGTVTVRQSSFINNDAVYSANYDYDNYGGAILNMAGTLTVEKSTFSGNGADDYGGAIYNAGTAVIKDCTFTSNFAAYAGGARFIIAAR